MSRGRESIAGPLIVSAVLGFNMCNLLRTIIDDKDEVVKAAQVHNAQVREQLIPTYQGLGQLILDEEHDTFVFKINSTDYPDQSCSGSFEVQKGMAVPVGSIACTTEHEVGGN